MSAEDSSEEDDGAPEGSPVARVAPRRADTRGLGLALAAVFALVVLGVDSAVSTHRAQLARAASHRRLEDLRDFLRATIDAGFEPPVTGRAGVELRAVVAAIDSWGLAPVVWVDGHILVPNGPDTFTLEVADARGRPYVFRRPGVGFPHGWEVASRDEALGADFEAELAAVGSEAR